MVSYMDKGGCIDMYVCGPQLSLAEIDLLENAQDIREVQFLGVRLVDDQCDYNPEAIAEYAKRQGLASKLGYLAEASLEAAMNVGIEYNPHRIKKLIDLVWANRNSGTCLLSAYDGQNDDVLKRLAERRSVHDLNKKWNVRSAMHASDIEEYMGLYLLDLRQGRLMTVSEISGSKKDIERNFQEFLDIVFD